MKDLSIRSEVQTPNGGDPAPQITPVRHRFRSFWCVAAAACLFILLSIAIIPYVGFEDDEVIFASPLYLVSPKEFGISIFHHRLPLMVMSYIGTLKTLLFLPILQVFDANVWSLRLPTVMVGALTIWMLYKLAKRSATGMAAILAAFLLASDPSFLFTNTIDWGPVALEHFLLVTGCFFLMKFGQEMVRGYLALGFFLFGLALWNKAIFIWALSGVVCAALVIFLQEVRRLLRPLTAAIAVVSFLLGALPLVVFNVRNRNATLSQSGHFEFDKFAGKTNSLRGTLDGSLLFGFLFALDDAPNPRAPASLHGRLATWVGEHTGKQHRDAMVYASLLSVLLIPWWWRYRAARFSLVFVIVTWLAMAATRDAGGSAHHSVLLWPFPQLFVAIALTSLPWRGIAPVAAIVLVVSNLLVVNQAIADCERNGTPANFSNAQLGLAHDFAEIRAPIVFTLDWGIVDVLAFAERGRLALHSAESPFRTETPTADNLKEIDWILAQPGAVFVNHVPGFENWPEVRRNLDRMLAQRALRKEILTIVPDSNARPVFEIFRVVPMSGQ